MLTKIKWILLYGGLVALIAGCFMSDYWIWSLEHPFAPKWIWWFK